MRMLAVIAPERLSAMPDVPTMPELGFKDMSTGTWIGIFVPGDARADREKNLRRRDEGDENPDVVKRLAVAGTRAVVSRSPEDSGAS